ncbi:MAG TPA: CBM20 domain-containing protein, partial [Verrucomicrobiae bacterium]|nr:CBM20 domain-containing protein [Verrucomicrobiae bacterium]
QVSGTFNSHTNGFYLSPGSNPNIYTATYNSSDALGTPETFAYTIIHGAGGSTPESTDARTFTLTNTQTLPGIYFSSYAPATNATVPLSFSVDMGVQIAAGSFNPGAGDQVFVYGDMNENAALAWGGSVALTPSGTNTNVYVGTFGDGNYAGTPCQYKFVRYSTALGQNVYESRANRTYNTPSSATNFPTVYFNDSASVTVVSFTVDMAAQTQFGKFTPGSDTIAVAGSFTGWAGGAVTCTNDVNTNLYSISIPIYDTTGTTEQYKFITYGPGISGTDYESPSSGGNRSFVLPSSSTNLPVVAFSDQYLSDYLLTDTTVIFTVNMSNAIQFPSGTPFNSGSDSVYVSGDFLGWPSWSASLPQLSPEGSSLLYTYTNVFAAGSPVVINYKYSIDGSDDEAPGGANHIRYIRGYGTYQMPVDTFGTQLVEQSFGQLVAGAPSSGHIPISWLGRPGVHLQVSSSVKGPWVDHAETDAMSFTNWPLGGSSLFFRLVHPEQ